MNLPSALWDGVRTVALRAPRANPLEGGPGLFLALVVVYLCVTFALATVEVPRPWLPVPYGMTTVLTDSFLKLGAAWVLMRVAQRDGIVWGVASILLAATIITSLIVHWPLNWAANTLLHEHPFVALLLHLVSSWWWLLVLIAVAHWLAPRSLGRTVLAAFLGYAVSAAVWWWLPAMPVLTTTTGATKTAIAQTDADTETSTSEDNADDQDQDQSTDASSSKPDFDAEQVMYGQPDLLDAAIAKLKPQTPGVTDLYVVAFAGDAEEDVFRNEAEYAEKLFAQRFDAEGRVLVLENSAATVATRP
ncbi:MAG TPA: hypothetical protein VGO25_00615, partial [Rhodanobacteraceae bacterium]|nr:hypothetical protein [Rhodanobacteraceae bacterium]